MALRCRRRWRRGGALSARETHGRMRQHGRHDLAKLMDIIGRFRGSPGRGNRGEVGGGRKLYSGEVAFQRLRAVPVAKEGSMRCAVVWRIDSRRNLHGRVTGGGASIGGNSARQPWRARPWWCSTGEENGGKGVRRRERARLLSFVVSGGQAGAGRRGTGGGGARFGHVPCGAGGAHCAAGPR